MIKVFFVYWLLAFTSYVVLFVKATAMTMFIICIFHGYFPAFQ